MSDQTNLDETPTAESSETVIKAVAAIAAVATLVATVKTGRSFLRSRKDRKVAKSEPPVDVPVAS